MASVRPAVSAAPRCNALTDARNCRRASAVRARRVVRVQRRSAPRSHARAPSSRECAPPSPLSLTLVISPFALEIPVALIAGVAIGITRHPQFASAIDYLHQLVRQAHRARSCVAALTGPRGGVSTFQCNIALVLGAFYSLFGPLGPLPRDAVFALTACLVSTGLGRGLLGPPAQCRGRAPPEPHRAAQRHAFVDPASTRPRSAPQARSRPRQR
jgi:hypothetical protein